MCYSELTKRMFNWQLKVYGVFKFNIITSNKHVLRTGWMSKRGLFIKVHLQCYLHLETRKKISTKFRVCHHYLVGRPRVSLRWARLEEWVIRWILLFCQLFLLAFNWKDVITFAWVNSRRLHDLSHAGVFPEFWLEW